MNERETYLVAADLIRRHGLCKNAASDEGGRLCMLGALGVAYGGRTMAWPSAPKSSLLDVVGGATHGDIIDFNDDRFLTKRDAIAALEIAADLAA
jgi:hypothetical protein